MWGNPVELKSKEQVLVLENNKDSNPSPLLNTKLWYRNTGMSNMTWCNYP